jgi:hypothetical protein
MDASDYHHQQITKLKIRGPAALAAALPYLVECPPEGCVVMAVLGPDSMLRLTAHRALPEYQGAAAPDVCGGWAEEVGRVVREGLARLDLLDGERIALAIFLPRGLHPLPLGLAGQLIPDAGALPPEMLDAVAVFDGRWRSLVCVDERCCPPEGLPILDNADAVDASVALIASGLNREAPPRPLPLPMPDRAAIEEHLAATPFPGSFDDRQAVLHQVWPLIADPAHAWTAHQVALAVLAGDRPGIRDALLVRMARRGRRPADRQWWQQQWRLWTSITATAPVGWEPGPACLRAISAWVLGDGMDALLALDEALEADPHHRMAVLLGDLVSRGTPASRWFASMRRIDEAECLRFDRPPPTRGSDGDQAFREAG